MHLFVRGLFVGLLRMADTNVILAFEDAQVIPLFSREEIDDTDNTDDTDEADDTSDTDDTDDTVDTDYQLYKYIPRTRENKSQPVRIVASIQKI